MTPPFNTGLWLLCLYHFGSRFAANIFFVTAQSAFFARVGVSALPWIYTAMNLVYISLQFVSMKSLQARSSVYLRRLALAFAALGAARFIFFPDAGFGFTTGFLLVVMVYELFFMQFFNHWLNDLFPLQEGKHSLPMIQAAGSLSFIASGLFLKLTLAFTSIDHLALAALILFLLAQALLPTISRHFGQTLPPAQIPLRSPAPIQAHAEPSPAPVSPAPPVLSDFAKCWCLLGFLTMIGKYWLDFQYSRAITTLYPNERDLAGFIAMFTATTDSLVLFGQMTVAGSILQRYPLPLVLSILPASCFLLGLWPTFTTSAWGVLVTQFFFTLIAKALHQSAGSLLLAAVPAAPRLRLMSASGIAASAGAMIAGLSLLLFQHALGTSTAFLLLETVFALMLLTTWVLARRWRTELVQGLAHLGTSESSISPGDSGDLGFSLDRSDARAIVLGQSGNAPHELLFSLTFSREEQYSIIRHLLEGSEQSRLSAIALISRLPVEDGATLLPPLLTDTQPPRVRASAVKALAVFGVDRSRETGSSALLSLLASPGLESRIRANLIEGLGEVADGTDFIEPVRKFLQDPDVRVRTAAIITLIRCSVSDEDVRQSLAALSHMLDNADSAFSRAAAVAAIGRLQHEAFLPELEKALNDSDPMVIRQAVIALGRIPIASSRQALTERRSRSVPPDLGPLFDSTIALLEQLTLDSVLALADDLTADERSMLLVSDHQPNGNPRREMLFKALSLADSDSRAALGPWLLEIRDASVLDLCSTFLAHSPAKIPFRPIIARARQLAFPEIIRLLAGSLERGALDVYDEILSGLWDRLLIGSAVREHLMETDPAYPLLQGTIALEEEFALVSRMTARRSPVPEEIVQALRKGARGDRFAVSLAIEILNPRLPETLAESARRFLRGHAGLESFRSIVTSLGFGEVLALPLNELTSRMNERITSSPRFATDFAGGPGS